MARNLCKTRCALCAGTVKVKGKAHKITPEEAGKYFSEYKGLTVAEAECKSCWASYLAWIFFPDDDDRSAGEMSEEGFFDLSFKHTFNDEPSEKDFGTTNAPLSFLYKLKTRAALRAAGVGLDPAMWRKFLTNQEQDLVEYYESRD